jgi:hypothetical protein
VLVALLAGFAATLLVVGLRWNRRHAPIPIGEGIRAVGRIGHRDPPLRLSANRAARRRRQIRLASTVTVCVLLTACVVSAHRDGLAQLVAVVVLLRILFEMLAHATRRRM